MDHGKDIKELQMAFTVEGGGPGTQTAVRPNSSQGSAYSESTRQYQSSKHANQENQLCHTTECSNRSSSGRHSNSSREVRKQLREQIKQAKQQIEEWHRREAQVQREAEELHRRLVAMEEQNVILAKTLEERSQRGKPNSGRSSGSRRFQHSQTSSTGRSQVSHRSQVSPAAASSRPVDQLSLHDCRQMAEKSDGKMVNQVGTHKSQQLQYAIRGHPQQPRASSKQPGVEPKLGRGKDTTKDRCSHHSFSQAQTVDKKKSTGDCPKQLSIKPDTIKRPADSIASMLASKNGQPSSSAKIPLVRSQPTAESKKPTATRGSDKFRGQPAGNVKTSGVIGSGTVVASVRSEASLQSRAGIPSVSSISVVSTTPVVIDGQSTVTRDHALSGESNPKPEAVGFSDVAPKSGENEVQLSRVQHPPPSEPSLSKDFLSTDAHGSPMSSNDAVVASSLKEVDERSRCQVEQGEPSRELPPPGSTLHRNQQLSELHSPSLVCQRVLQANQPDQHLPGKHGFPSGAASPAFDSPSSMVENDQASAVTDKDKILSSIVTTECIGDAVGKQVMSRVNSENFSWSGAAPSQCVSNTQSCQSNNGEHPAISDICTSADDTTETSMCDRGMVPPAVAISPKECCHQEERGGEPDATKQTTQHPQQPLGPSEAVREVRQLMAEARVHPSMSSLWWTGFTALADPVPPVCQTATQFFRSFELSQLAIKEGKYISHHIETPFHVNLHELSSQLKSTDNSMNICQKHHHHQLIDLQKAPLLQTEHEQRDLLRPTSRTLAGEKPADKEPWCSPGEVIPRLLTDYSQQYRVMHPDGPVLKDRPFSSLPPAEDIVQTKKYAHSQLRGTTRVTTIWMGHEDDGRADCQHPPSPKLKSLSLVRSFDVCSPHGRQRPASSYLDNMQMSLLGFASPSARQKTHQDNRSPVISSPIHEVAAHEVLEAWTDMDLHEDSGYFDDDDHPMYVPKANGWQ